MTSPRYIYPANFSRHIATILGFPSKQSIAPEYYSAACAEIITLGTTISAFEPVRLYARPEDVPTAHSLLEQQLKKLQAASASSSSSTPTNVTNANPNNIRIIPLPTNHLWVRDTGPVYVRSASPAPQQQNQRYAINFRFSEWGRKETVSSSHGAADGKDWPEMSAAEMRENAQFASAVIAADSSPSPVQQVESSICLEGGALVVDGEGTLLATESSILNPNRNPGMSRGEIEAELRRLLGVEKIVWFPGKRGLDVTDVHVDAEVNFVAPGVVVVSKPWEGAPKAWKDVYEEIMEVLGRETDARGRRFEVHVLQEPAPGVLGELAYEDVATNYVNFYFVNGGLVVPQFGDRERDREALEMCRRTIQRRQRADERNLAQIGAQPDGNFPGIGVHDRHVGIDGQLADQGAEEAEDRDLAEVEVTSLDSSDRRRGGGGNSREEGGGGGSDIETHFDG
ncbi:hypothetical protein FE257_007860 [Aspergillus nanangensis]|uniref:Agmatine deiminase n=1 Tax=Aspergillus nanangensis TaxID=2582783 RepID=A0AAD4GYT5_ASPNN|nr:hypothetical protein FE257_007860 [Aspergillus nanangensis]